MANVNKSILTVHSSSIEAAVEEGATLVRFGTAVFGERVYR